MTISWSITIYSPHWSCHTNPSHYKSNNIVLIALRDRNVQTKSSVLLKGRTAYQPSIVSENWNVDIHLRSASSLFWVSFSVKGHFNFPSTRDTPFCSSTCRLSSISRAVLLHSAIAVGSTEEGSKHACFTDWLLKKLSSCPSTAFVRPSSWMISFIDVGASLTALAYTTIVLDTSMVKVASPATLTASVKGSIDGSKMHHTANFDIKLRRRKKRKQLFPR